MNWSKKITYKQQDADIDSQGLNMGEFSPVILFGIALTQW